jgi:hypothetical protein
MRSWLLGIAFRRQLRLVAAAGPPLVDRIQDSIRAKALENAQSLQATETTSGIRLIGARVATATEKRQYEEVS